MGFMVAINSASGLTLTAGQGAHGNCHFVFKAQPQRRKHSFVSLDATLVGAASQVEGFALVVAMDRFSRMFIVGQVPMAGF